METSSSSDNDSGSKHKDEIEMTESSYMGDKTKQVAVGALLYAASTGDGAEVTKMLKSGDVKVNDGDYDRRTALHIAACEGHLELVKSLIKGGADVNAKDRWGATPLDESVRHGQETISTYLRKHGGANGTASNFGLDLIHAAHKGDLKKVQMLVNTGVSIESVDYDNRSALHVAIADRQYPVVKYLLDRGADPMATDRWGKNCVDEAERVKLRLGEDPIWELLKPTSHTPDQHLSRIRSLFFWFATAWEIIFGVLFAIFVSYDIDNNGKRDPSLGADLLRDYYGFYMDVHVMIFIGFGFLMTFLRKYGYTSVGLNFFLGVVAIQWYILVGGFFHHAFDGDFSKKIPLNIATLIKGDFAAGAVLISFGALLGKTSPLQMMALCLAEVFFYVINEEIGIHLGIADLGGSMVIHTFGAYFGLAASLLMTPKSAKGHKDNSACYRSDLFSMIGTIFLFMYWPSFNAAFGVGNTKHRAVVNTVISLCASTTMAFIMSMFIRGEHVFNMVDVQNATLAGGVAMGASADLVIHPAVAILIGSVAGTVSVFGFRVLQPRLEKHIGLHDTCGVHNLHGMPGIIGAIAGIIAASVADADLYGADQLALIYPLRSERTASKQATYQLAYLVITLSIAIASGLMVGFFLKFLDNTEIHFSDETAWEVPNLEIPYYFDERGEIDRDHEIIEKAQKVHTKTEDTMLVAYEKRIAHLEKAMREMTESVNATKGARSDSSANLLKGLDEKINKLLEK